MNMIIRTLVLLALAACGAAQAHEGDLDTSFNGTGKLTFAMQDSLPELSNAVAVAIQADGKIVVVGSSSVGEPLQSQFAIARINPGGSLDNSFGTGGRVTLAFGAATNSASALAVAIQSDGKIVVGGYYLFNLAIARLNSDGSLDGTFSNGGVYLAHPGSGAQPYVDAFVFEPQVSGGQLIVFAGSSSTGLGGSSFLRGWIDSTGMFPHIDLVPGGPFVSNGFAGVVAQGNKIAMVGFSQSSTSPYPRDCSTRRYRLGVTAGGSTLQFFDDPSFVSSDFALDTSANAQCNLSSVAVLPNGDLVLGGYQTQGSVALRGAFAFGLHGADGSANAMIAADAFTPDASPLGAPTTVLAQADGRVVLAGTGVVSGNDHFIVQRRFWQSANQSRDPGYAAAGTATIDFDHDGLSTSSDANAAVLDSYGRAVVVGATRDAGSSSTLIAVARLQGDLIFSDGFELP